MRTPEQQATIDRTIDKLVKWANDVPGGESFSRMTYLVTDNRKKATWALGWAIWDAAGGGESGDAALVEVSKIIESRLRVRGDMSELTCAWDGVGSWRW